MQSICAGSIAGVRSSMYMCKSAAAFGFRSTAKTSQPCLRKALPIDPVPEKSSRRRGTVFNKCRESASS